MNDGLLKIRIGVDGREIFGGGEKTDTNFAIDIDGVALVLCYRFELTTEQS